MSWRQIVESEEYKRLPQQEKVKTKQEYWSNTIKKSPKFQALDAVKKEEVFNEFFSYRPQEGIKSTPITRLFETADRPVEEIAKFIEPDKAEEGFMGALKFVPRQMAADYVRAYKPSTALPFLLGAKLAKPVIKPIAGAIWKRIPEGFRKVLQRNLFTGKGQPPAYQQAAQQAQLERAAGAREAGEVAKILTTKPTGQPLSLEEQRYIGRIFRKEVVESPALKAHPKYQELKIISDQGRAIMDKWSGELAKSGIPKESTAKIIEENIGRYMPRMFTTKLKPKETGLGFFKQLRLRLGMLKHRKDLSERVLRELGEIKEPALPTAIRVKETSANIANNRLFTKVAQNPEWVSKEPIQGWVKMPDTPSVGPLKNKWVIREIGEDVNAIVSAGEQGRGAYAKLLSAWKFGKVALNPATQTRNFISNTILLDLSGTPHPRQLKLFPRAFDELIKQGPVYQQALKDGAIGGEFMGTETMQQLKNFYIGSQKNNFQRWLDMAKMPFKKAGELYQGIEQAAKLVKYMDVLERGGTGQLAAEQAQKWLFNYEQVPKFVDWARKSPFGAPFITFTWKAIPRVAEAMVEHPLKVYKYKALFQAYNEMSRKYQGMLPTDFARARRNLPSYLLKDIGGVPTNLLLPWKDKHNRTQWLNLEYILPVGQVPEMLEQGVKGFVSNPIFNILADLVKNRDFRDQPIIPVGADKGEATHAVISHVYRQLMPSMMPGIPSITEGFKAPIVKGGYSFEKILDAVYKRPDFAERTRELTPVLFDVLAGLKVNPLDVDEAEGFRMYERKKTVDELNRQLRKLSHPAISDKERERKADRIFKKIQKILSEP